MVVGRADSANVGANTVFGALGVFDVSMYLGYNTNGMSNHRLEDAIELLADVGYEGVAITLDHGALNPYDQEFDQLPGIQRMVTDYGMRSVIETGARFLLDPTVKHEPTLVSHGWVARERRIDFLKRAIVIAATLGSDCVSLWSGVAPQDVDGETVWERLIYGLTSVADIAAANSSLRLTSMSAKPYRV